MKPIGAHNYFVYMTTNRNKSVLYTGVTNDLLRRLNEHKEESFKGKRSFVGRYNAYYLVYYECFDYILNAISREKEIKSWKRKKKDALVAGFNPEWKFLNEELEP